MRPGKAVLSTGACALLLVLSPAMAFASPPNDTLYPQQWALNGAVPSIHAPQAWCASTGNVLVADVDTGADFNHPDLAGKLVPGAAFLGSSNEVPTGTGQAAVQDGNGHGTMTTGIMVADTNNGIGISAVAPAAKALIVKVLADDGTGNASDVAAGIDYASSYPGVTVINLSIGSDQGGLLSLLLGPGPNPILPAIDRALQRGVMVSAAAGNTPGKTSEYSGLADRALVVGALAPSGGMASYSEGGNIYAPGGDGGSNKTPATSVTSTGLNGVYMAGDGTSFAAPQVAGAVALLMAKGFNAAQARAQILASATSPSGLPQLDAANALGVADNAAPCVPGAATSPPVRPPAPRPRPVAPPPAPVAVAPPPSPSPSVSASPSPEASPFSAEPPSPDTGTLAVRTSRPRQHPLLLLGFAFTVSDSLWLLAAGLIGGMAAGYGALTFIKAVGRD